jgi:hypothetical protein
MAQTKEQQARRGTGAGGTRSMEDPDFVLSPKLATRAKAMVEAAEISPPSDKAASSLRRPRAKVAST